MTSKILTRKQTEDRKHKAELFVASVPADEKRADEIRNESLQAWADRTSRTLNNRLRKIQMATKIELQALIDQASDIPSDAYAPETNREDLAAAMGQALGSGQALPQPCAGM